MLAGGGEVARAAGQGREPVVQLPARRQVPACFRKPHPAGEPSARSGPLARPQRHVAEPQARRDCACLVELRLRGALPQLGRLHRPLPDGQVRAVTRPLRLLLRPRDREDQAAERQQHFQLREEPERLLHAHRREGAVHSPYSFILRVSVLRWIPRISAAAPICPLVWASTRAMWRASTSASVSSPRVPASGSVASAARSSSGRCSAWIVVPVATMTARSTTLRSSRTLPTHGWPRSSSSARSEMLRICFR